MSLKGRELTWDIRVRNASTGTAYYLALARNRKFSGTRISLQELEQFIISSPFLQILGVLVSINFVPGLGWSEKTLMH